MEIRRSLQRERAFLVLFAHTYGDSVDDIVPLLQGEQDDFQLGDFGEALLSDYEAHQDIVNETIDKWLKGWRSERIPRTSISILRLAIAEMLYTQPGKDSVVINEAVELSKKYGDEKDFQFVNGLLGNVSRSLGNPSEDSTDPEATDNDVTLNSPPEE